MLLSGWCSLPYVSAGCLRSQTLPQSLWGWNGGLPMSKWELPNKPMMIITQSWQVYKDLLEAFRNDPCVWASGWAGEARWNGQYRIDLHVCLPLCKELGE